MNRYELWVFLHVSSVIVWIGAGTTLMLVTLYGRHNYDRPWAERLVDLSVWLGKRVFGPAALGALVFGMVAAHSGHLASPLWVRLGYGAIVVSLLLNFGGRLPLFRRVRRGSTSAIRGVQLLRAVALVELTVLYLGVADMVAKPTRLGAAALATSGGAFALATILALVLGRQRESGLTRR